MTYFELKRYWINELGNVVESGEANAMLSYFLQNRLQRTVSQIILDSSLLQSIEFSEVANIVQRLKLKEPLQYILQHATFMDLNIHVEKGVLIPRPETEELVLLVLNKCMKPDGRILDICTGSGCIALAIKHRFPEANVIAADVSAQALRISSLNSQKLNLDIDVLEWDVFDNPPTDLNVFDAIVSNPPYIPDNEYNTLDDSVLNYEPKLALHVPEDDPIRFYTRMAELGKDFLKPGGLLAFEINPHFSSEIMSYLEHAGYSTIELIQDMQLKNRFVTARKS
jgi:release factor glutamine methyltransferase